MRLALAAGLAALLAAVPVAGAPAQAWAFEGPAVAYTHQAPGMPCGALFSGVPGAVRLALVDSPGGGFDSLAFTFTALPPVSLMPCALARAGCVGAGDATEGWFGVCAEGFPWVTWGLTPRGDGAYAFRSVAPLGPAGWAVDGTVGGTSVALPA